MGRRYLDSDVLTESLRRLRSVMAEGHRVVCSFSAGKDSGVMLELALEAAREEDYGVLDVVMRDEEIMLPGTYEYAERVAEREDVRFHWLIAHQPIINAFNRASPYWWVFDPLLDPSEWVRQPPPFAEVIPDLHIEAITNDRSRFDVPEHKDLIVLIGLRGSESRGRMYGIYSSGGWLTKTAKGVRKGRPIYDWSDGDVWREIRDNKWDYNHAYDVMFRMGVARKNLRIAPPTMRAASLQTLQVGARAWPRWFDRVADRLPGVRTAAQFGRRAVEPQRRMGESWQATFERTCLQDAPDWIIERATKAMHTALKRHGAHSSDLLPQVTPCKRCVSLGSWQQMAMTLYMGDPFSFATDLPYMEPEFFRQGAGTWGGSPAFA